MISALARGYISQEISAVQLRKADPKSARVGNSRGVRYINNISHIKEVIYYDEQS